MIKLIDGSNMLHRAVYDLNGTGKLGIHPLRDLYLQFMMADHSTMIVWDGMWANKRRRDIYPAYKGNRPEKAEDIKASFEIIKQVLVHCPVTQVEADGWEGDDVLYTLATSMIGDKTVITNDSDFWQLADDPEVKLPLVKPLPCRPSHTPLFKALVGDKADNIPGWRGFGIRKWEQIVTVADDIEYSLKSEDYDKFASIEWPKGLIPDYGTFYEICTFYRITQMQMVPADDITACMGESNPALAEQILSNHRI